MWIGNALIFLVLYVCSAFAVQISGKLIIPFIHYDSDTYISVGDGYGIILGKDGRVIYRVGDIDFWEVLGKPSDIKLLNESVTKVSVFKGRHSDFKRGLKTYEEIRLVDVYEGVDVIFRFRGNGIEKLYVFRKGVNPENIKFSLGGTDTLKLKEDGGLLIIKESW